MTRDELFARLLIDTRFDVRLKAFDDGTHRGIFSRRVTQYMQCSFARTSEDIFAVMVARVPFRDGGYSLSFPRERRDKFKLLIDNLQNVDAMSGVIDEISKGKPLHDIPLVDEVLYERVYRYV